MSLENKKDLEKKEEQKKSNSDLKQEFLNILIKENLNWKDKNKFIDEVMDNDDLTEDLKAKILKVKAYNDKFSDFDTSKINIFDLKRWIWKEYLKLDTARKNYLNETFSSFDLTEKERKKLEKEIKNLSEKELEDLTFNQEQNSSFLKKIFKKEIFRNRSFSFLEKLSSKEINNRLKRLKQDKRKKVEESLYNLSNWIFNNEDIKDLFLTWFLKDEEKKQILQKFIPFVNLGDLLDKNIITKKEALKLREKILKEKLKKDFKEDEIEKIINNTSFSDIKVDIRDILRSSNLDRIVSSLWFFKAQDEFNDFKDKVKEDLEKNGPQNFEELKKLLKEYWVENIDSFKKNSVIEITLEWKWTYIKEYLRLDNFSDEEKIISLSSLWASHTKNSKVNLNTKWFKYIEKSYIEFVELFKKYKAKAKVYDKNTFESIIKDDSKFVVDSDVLNLYSVDDLKNNEEERKRISTNLKKDLQSEIDELKKDIEEQEQKLNKKDIWESEKNELKAKIKKLKALLEEKEEELKDIENWWLNNLVKYQNYEELVKKINNLDPKWEKFWLKKWVVLETEKGAYEIVWLDKEKWTISLQSMAWMEANISYESFFQAFKKNKAKRVEKINDLKNYLEKKSLDPLWKGLTVKNWKLIKKDVSFTNEKWEVKKEDKKIDYLCWEKWELLKIEDIWADYIEIKFWELKTKKKWKNTTHNISLEKKSSKISFNEFDKLVRLQKLAPDWKIWKNLKEWVSDDYKNNIKWSFATRFWNRTSLLELVSGWKMLIDWITESIKKWNDVRAAEFALWLARFLPEEIREDFRTTVEANQSEAMEKELWKLSKISSSAATKRIKKWLLNKDTPEFRKEAWLMYIAKYGVLYAKALWEFNGTFLWYEALGWRIWDELYNQHKEANNWIEPFDEVALIIDLLSKQSSWKLKPRRRSKFYKEFKWKIAAWFKKELEDWYNDAKDKRTIWEIIDGWYWEIFWNTVPNSLWWAKRAVEKWGSLKEMNELYFVLLFSWTLYEATSSIKEELKNHFINQGNWNLLAMFGSSTSWQELLNETIVKLSEDIEKAYPEKYIWMHKKAKEIFDFWRDSSIPHAKKIEKTRDFWNEYGEVLVRALYMKEDNNPNYAKIDKIIFFWKDWKYKDYYETARAYISEPTSYSKDFMMDATWAEGWYWANNFAIVKRYFNMDQTRTFRERTVVDKVWPNLWKDLLSVKDKIKAWWDKDLYRKYLNNKLREITAWLLARLWDDLLKALEDSDPVWLDLKKIWIRLSEFKWVRIEDILNWDALPEVFNNAVENLLIWNFDDSDKKDYLSIFKVAEDIWEAANNVLYDWNLQKAA